MTSLTVWLLLGAFVAVNCDSELDRLHHTPVYSAQWVSRPKQDIPSWVPSWCVTTYSGIRVKLHDGQEFLMHKGPDYDVTSETQVKKTSYVFGRTFGDFVKASEKNSNIWSGQNCHIMAEDMMNLGKN